jgi:hypothetical protein
MCMRSAHHRTSCWMVVFCVNIAAKTCEKNGHGCCKCGNLDQAATMRHATNAEAQSGSKAVCRSSRRKVWRSGTVDRHMNRSIKAFCGAGPDRGRCDMRSKEATLEVC